MLTKTKMVVYNEEGEVIGWLRNYGCENAHCTVAFVNGAVWHAIPRHGELDTYHFSIMENALRALHGANLRHKQGV